MKRCTKCGAEKPRSDFSRDLRKKDGLNSWCKECRCEQQRAYYAANAEARREYKREHYAANAEALREHSRKYKDANAEAIREQKREYYAANKQKYRAHNAVRCAIAMGRLARQPCEVCGETVVDAHHDDYTRPLDIRWLCRRHHQRHHTELEREQDEALY